jgi:hypothetical protein
MFRLHIPCKRERGASHDARRPAWKAIEHNYNNNKEANKSKNHIYNNKVNNI